MTDYGHDLLFGSFITPTSTDVPRVLELTAASESAGLDLATFQDHPYQPGFLDTWTLLSFLAARTSTLRLVPNVLNLPLRPPAVVARSAASLDRLSGGRIELGLGAGAFWDAIVAMGGERLTPGESIVALGEAIEIIRGVWDTDDTSLLRVGGTHHRIEGAKRGPAPAHDMGIWLGAYKPRILRLTGRAADGWLPSLAYMTSIQDLVDANEIIDGAAEKAGRQPSDVRRLLNVTGRITTAPSEQMLVGPPEQWVEQLATLTLEHGFSGYVLGGDDARAIAVLGQEIAPALRELVATERRR